MEFSISEYDDKSSEEIVNVYEFVVGQLQRNRPCGNQRNKVKSTAINRRVLDIVISLSHYFLAMKSLECLFDNQLFNSQIARRLGLPQLGDNAMWINKQSEISKGGYGATFVGSIPEYPNVKFIIKQSLKNYYIKQTTIEYFLGATVINNFRKYCPNFCYTLGAFVCSAQTTKPGPLCKPKKGAYTDAPPSIFYEYIDGITTDRVYDIKLAVSVLIQVLLALEIGQREARFCHNDLGVNNCMVSNVRQRFSILLDDQEYSFDSQIAKIIDFGMTCATFKGKQIFTGVLLDSPHYKRNGYLVQGLDPFMFIMDMAVYSKSDAVQHYMEHVIRLFSAVPIDEVRDAKGYIAVLISNDLRGLASCSPLSILTRLLADPTTKRHLADHLEIKPRRMSSVNPPINLAQIYNELYGLTAPTQLDGKGVCVVSKIDSFIILEELIVKLGAQGENAFSRTFRELLEVRQSRRADVLRENDRVMLDKFNYLFTVAPITEGMQRAVRLLEYEIHDVTVGDRNGIIDFLDKTGWMVELEAFTSIYFLIRELNLFHGEPYRQFCLDFEARNVFNITYVISARRWAQTLLESMEYNRVKMDMFG